MTESIEQLQARLALVTAERDTYAKQNQQLTDLLRFVRKNFWLDDEGTEARDRKPGETALTIGAVLADEATWQICPVCDGGRGRQAGHSWEDCSTCQGRGGFSHPNSVSLEVRVGAAWVI